MEKRILSVLLSLAMIFCTISPFLNDTKMVKAATIGTTYYVSALTGSDHNDGMSESKAFYSLQKINEIVLKPGDQVLLQAGSIFNDGYLHLKGSGSADAPIVVGRYGTGNDPVIATNGQGIWYQNYGKSLDSSSHRYKGYVSSCILLYDIEYVEISNIELTNEDVFAGVKYSAIDKLNRTGVAAVAKDKGTVNHIYLKNLNVHDVDGNVYDKHMNNGGIYFTVFKPTDDTKTGIARYDDVLIEGCHVENVSRWGIAVGYTAYWNQFTTAVIKDSVSEMYGSTNVVIRNNYIKDVGGDAITTMYCHRPLIEYNVSDGAAKEINTTIYNETSSGRVAAAIWPWKCKDAIFQYNEAFDTCTNQDGQAWDADYGDGTVYQYNYSHNNGGGCVMICGGEAINTVFRYNISQNDLSGVLNLPGHPLAHIYNNTFYIKEGVSFIRTGMTGGTALIENNIIYNAGTKKTEDWLKNSRITYSNNIYYNYNNTPEDAYQITEDPKLVNPGTAPIETLGIVHDISDFNGYQLQTDSPAIGNGKYIENNGGKDFFGNELDTTPDIGACGLNTSSLENSDCRINSTIYMLRETSKEIYIPNLDNVPTSVDEVKRGIQVQSTSAIKFYQGNQEVLEGNITEGMNLKIVAEDGTENIYTIHIKNEYKYVNDFVPNQQGNIWFSQEKISGVYENLTNYNTAWGCWTGSLYSCVGLHSPISDKGILCNLGDQNEESHSMAFRAPKIGTVKLAFRDPIQLRNVNGQGTVQVAVTVNGEIVDGPYTLLNDKTALTIDAKEYALNQGDYLRIEAMDEGTKSSSFYVNPEVTYINKAIEVIDIEKPSIPSNITVSDIGETSASLSWDTSTDNVGVTGYQIILSPNNQTEVVSGTSIHFNDLTEGTQYSVAIVAIDGAGNQSEPGIVTFITTKAGEAIDSENPSSPTNIVVSSIEETSATISWNTSTDNVGVAGYEIILSPNNQTKVVSGTSIRFNELKKGTEYIVSIVAIDTAWNKSTPSSITFVTKKKNVPEVPTTPGDSGNNGGGNSNPVILVDSNTKPVTTPALKIQVDGSIEIELDSTMKLPTKEIMEQIQSQTSNNIVLSIVIPVDNGVNLNNLILEEEIMNVAKENNKTISVTIKSGDGNVMYSWNFDGIALNNSNRVVKAVNLALHVMPAMSYGKENSDFRNLIKKDKKNTYEMSSIISCAYTEELPVASTLRVYVSVDNVVKPESKLYLYSYNDKTKKLEEEPNNSYEVGKDGYIILNVTKGDDYILLPNRPSSAVVTTLMDQVKISINNQTISKKSLYVGDKNKNTAVVKVILPNTLIKVSAFGNTIKDRAVQEVKITYTTSNKNIATVSKSGKIIAKKPGKVTITTTVLSNNGINKKVKTTVTVKK